MNPPFITGNKYPVKISYQFLHNKKPLTNVKNKNKTKNTSLSVKKEYFNQIISNGVQKWRKMDN